MKVKHSVIPFIPIAILMIVLKLMGIFGLDSNGLFLGLNKINIIYAVIGIALVLFLICVFINILDRKTAPVYPLKHNIPAGILSVLAGASIMASSLYAFVNTAPNSEGYVMSMVSAIISIPAGIALIVMSKAHFSGKTVVSAASMLFVFPSLWGCVQLVFEFLEATKVSISATDLTPLFCYIFITLFFFSDAMVLSRIKGRNPVKGCFIYGLPAIAVSLAYGIEKLFVTLMEETESAAMITGILVAVQFILIAVYALSFILEMSLVTYTKDDIEIIDGLEAEEQFARRKQKARYVDTEDYDEIAYSHRGENENTEAPEEEVDSDDGIYSYRGHENLDDFIIGYGGDKEDSEPVPYLTKDEMKKSVDSQVVIPTGTEDAPYGSVEPDEGDKLVDSIMNSQNTASVKKPAEKGVREDIDGYIIGSSEKDGLSASASEARSSEAKDFIMNDSAAPASSTKGKKIKPVGKDELVENIMGGEKKNSDDELDEISKLLSDLENQ